MESSFKLAIKKVINRIASFQGYQITRNGNTKLPIESSEHDKI